MSLSLFQTMKIVAFSFVPAHFGFFMPWASASMIFNPLILIFLAVANLGHIAMTEWSQEGSLRSFKKLTLIYLIFLGGVAVEFPSLSADVMENLFHSSGTQNIHLEKISDQAILYAIIGSFFFEMYYIYIYKIEKKLHYAILSRV